MLMGWPWWCLCLSLTDLRKKPIDWNQILGPSVYSQMTSAQFWELLTPSPRLVCVFLQRINKE